MAVVLSPQRVKTDGGSDGYGRREAQGRDHRRLGKPDGLPPAGRPRPSWRQRFVRAYYRDVAPDDLAERDPLDLYGAALAQLRSAELRQPGEVKLRVYNPKLEQHGWQSTHTVVEIVNDDMPFLVDSVGIELNRHGLNIHLVIHPVLAVRRDEAGRLVDLGTAEQVGDGLRESFMLLEIDRQTRPEVLTQLEADLRRVLGDVRHAVQDWQAMRGRIEAALEEVRAGASSVPAERRAEAEAFLAWIGDGQLHPAGLLQLPARGQPHRGAAAADEGNGARHSPRIRRRRPVPELQQPAARDPRARPRAAASAHRHQGQHSQHGTSRYLSRLHRGQAVRAGRQRGRRAPFPRPADLDRLQHEPAADPHARPQGRARDRPGRVPARRPCRQGFAAHHRDLPARRVASDPRGRAVRHRDGHPPP